MITTPFLCWRGLNDMIISQKETSGWKTDELQFNCHEANHDSPLFRKLPGE